MPCVFVNRREPGSGRNVSMREEDAGRIAAEHLISLGHTLLGQIAGPLVLDTARAARARASPRPRWPPASTRPAIVESPFQESSACLAIGELMDARTRPTGIFISNLNQAIGGLAGVRRRGIRVPEDVSLISLRRRSSDRVPRGAADDDPHAALRAGRRGDLGARPSGRRRRPYDLEIETLPELVVRASTAPPPRSGTHRMRIRAAVFTAPEPPARGRRRSSSTRRGGTRCSCGSQRPASAAATCPTSTASGRCRCRWCSGTRAPARSRRSARASTPPASASASC